MNGTEDRRLSIRRILVALDASPHSFAALQAAAELAGRLGAELRGLFVEDINLIRMTELSFVRELSFFSPLLKELELGQLERQLRAQASMARQALAAAAQREGVPWDFRIARGAVATELLAAEADADLTIVGRIGRSLGVRRIGSTVRVIALKGTRLTLILQHGSRLIIPVMAVYDGSPLARKALEAAAQLVHAKNTHLSVFIVAENEDRARRLRTEAMEQLRSYDLDARVHAMVSPTLSRIAHAVQMEGSGPVVVPCGEGILFGEGLCALLNVIPNPVLLVR